MVFLDFLLSVSETVIGIVTNCFNFFSFLDEMLFFVETNIFIIE